MLLRSRRISGARARCGRGRGDRARMTREARNLAEHDSRRVRRGKHFSANLTRLVGRPHTGPEHPGHRRRHPDSVTERRLRNVDARPAAVPGLQQRSMSSKSMNIVSSKPPSARSRSRRTSMAAPFALTVGTTCSAGHADRGGSPAAAGGEMALAVGSPGRGQATVEAELLRVGGETGEVALELADE